MCLSVSHSPGGASVLCDVYVDRSGYVGGSSDEAAAESDRERQFTTSSSRS